MSDTLLATSCMVVDSCCASADRSEALTFEARVLFRTSPVIRLMRPELSLMVFKMLLIGTTTYLVISFRSANTSRTHISAAAAPTASEIMYVTAR